MRPVPISLRSNNGPPTVSKITSAPRPSVAAETIDSSGCDSRTNRVSVFVQWVWTYLTGQRGSQLIVNHHGPVSAPAAVVVPLCR
jgi:hypothetical protein